MKDTRDPATRFVPPPTGKQMAALELKIARMQRDHQEAIESLQRQIKSLEKRLAVKG